MTRKEICESVGISIKTLRLYEEKGLITPVKEQRNGREYREYSPELVEELEKIVTLRRARFTMEEIHTMCSAPEKIPEVFRDYRQWLQQETEQFLKLRVAAEGIEEESLTKLDDLITELGATARDMPLPRMDIRPNFRRLDEMEEPPRQVTAQTHFDETIPDDRVFRQVNLVMDRDKGNNNAILFGQMQDMKHQGLERGPVRREEENPRWYRICSIILSLLLVAGFVLAMVYHHWYLFFGLVAARMLWAGIPAVMDHRRWVKDYTRPDPEETARDRKKRSRLVLLGGLGLAAAVGVGCMLYYIIDSQVNPTADVRIWFYAQGYLTEKEVYTMGQSLSTLVEDLDGNGKACGVVEYEKVSPEAWVMGDYVQYKLPKCIQNAMETGETALFFIDNQAYNGFNLCEEYRFYRYCRTLPEDIQAADNPYCADVTGAEIFQCVGEKDWPVYACISKNITEEEYEVALELLRRIMK